MGAARVAAGFAAALGGAFLLGVALPIAVMLVVLYFLKLFPLTGSKRPR